MIVYTHNDCLKKFNGLNHPERKERLKAMSKIEDIVEEFNKVKQEQMTRAKQEKKI